MVGHTDLGSLAESPDLPPSLHGGEGSYLPGSTPPNEIVNSKSVVGIKTGDSGVVSGYNTVEFTHTWLIKYFTARSHIYPGFTGKVSVLTYFPLEPRCEDYPCEWLKIFK